MRTSAQRNSSRLNSLNSTGPRTPAGKARCAMNALKTGIHTTVAVMFGESATEYAALVEEYYAYHCPVSPQQRTLVDTLITCEWQRRRMVTVEPEVWMEQANLNSYVHCDRPEFRDRGIASESGRAWLAADQQFNRIQRRMDGLYRTYLSAMKELQTLCADELPDQEIDQDISTTQPTGESPLNPSSALFRAEASLIPHEPVHQAA